MRTVIAGSRSIRDVQHVHNAMRAALQQHNIQPTVVLSGMAVGVDLLGEAWAESAGVPIERYPANWNVYGKRAGAMRNARMAHACEALVAVWDGHSAGTRDMIERCVALGRRVAVWRVAA